MRGIGSGMVRNSSHQLRITHHTLRITDPRASVAFYRDALGMTLLAERDKTDAEGQKRHYFLGFAAPRYRGADRELDLMAQPNTLLELLHDPDQSARNDGDDPHGKVGYWKIGVTLADVDLARQRLIDIGVEVGAAQQFLDVGYLCHLSDPDGYCIELLQHRFAHHHQPARPQPQPMCRLGSVPTFGQITLRVKDPEASLRFYVEGLGLRLLSRQTIEPYRFTLYFLACSDEQPPHRDIDDVGNREWLWQRPYTVLELQHVWGTQETDFTYRVGPDTGFERISFAVRGLDTVVEALVGGDMTRRTLAGVDPLFQVNAVDVLDPDGYTVRLNEYL